MYEKAIQKMTNTSHKILKSETVNKFKKPNLYLKLNSNNSDPFYKYFDTYF